MRFSRLTRRKTPAIGALELDVLKRLWSVDEAIDARSVLESLTGRRASSLSTVQATLERLYRKGLLSRSKVSRAYFYTPAVSREQLIALLIGDVAERLAEGELEPVVSGFIELVGDADPKLLERLESGMQRRRDED